MTNSAVQVDFKPFPFLSDGGLNVHEHSSKAPTLIVFVHGLLGDGYDTWGQFPRFMFDAQFDVAVFDYPTGPERAKRFKTPPPPASARLLAQEIADLGNRYDDIFLFGHSMGGHVAALAACEFFTDLPLLQHTTIQPLAGLFAFASPLGGSLGASVRLSSDLRFLARGGSSLRKFREYAAKHLDCEVSEFANSNRYSFPIHSLSAMNDIWVKRTISSFGVPQGQAQDCVGTHTELVKPPTSKHKAVQWSVQTISKIRLMRARTRRLLVIDEPGDATDPGFRTGVVVATLCDRSEPKWVEAFTEALISTSESYELQVLDARHVDQSLKPSLVVQVVRATEVLSEPVRLRGEVIQQVSNYAEPTRTQMAVGPTGNGCDRAEQDVRTWLREENLHTSTWVHGSVDEIALRSKIIEWLHLVVRAHLHTSSPIPDRRRSDVLREALQAQPDRFESRRPFGGEAW